MTFNGSPLKPITKDHISTYHEDGVVCLRQIFDLNWIDSLRPIAERISEGREDFGLIPSMPGRYMSRRIPEFRRFIFDSPLAEAGARVIGSKQARFFFDEIFAKPPHSESKTIWHSDRMGWPVKGKMVPSLWVPLTPVRAENSLECILGSHTRDIPQWLFSPNARQMIRPPDRVPHPNEEELRADPGNRFKAWDMEPGDMLVVHPWILHYSAGNTADEWRLALSVRVFGDDIIWAPRPDCVNLAGVSFDEMVEGDPPAGPLFPVLWSESGYKDDDKEFPAGFATTWSKARKSEVNEGELFATLLKQEAQ